jgi:hypothetical protein
MKVAPGSVVILAGEGHAGLRGRIAAWKQSHSVKSVSAFVSRHGVDLDTAAGVEQVLSSIDALPEPPVLVVCDTVHAHMTGDENSARDTGAMLAGCRAILSRYGCTVMLVHHTGNSETAQHRARGSSAWRAALDVEISVQVVNGVRVLEQTKNKDAQAAKPKAFELEPVTIDGWQDDDGEPVTSAIASPAEPPTKKQPVTKLEAHKAMFSAAWFATQAELSENKPYISRSALLDYLTVAKRWTNGTAQAAVRPGTKGKPICDLLAAGAIEVWEHGWAIVEPEWATSLILQRGANSGSVTSVT